MQTHTHIPQVSLKANYFTCVYSWTDSNLNSFYSMSDKQIQKKSVVLTCSFKTTVNPLTIILSQIQLISIATFLSSVTQISFYPLKMNSDNVIQIMTR